MYTGSLIGKSVKVLESRDRSLLAKAGMIVDERRSILKIKPAAEKRIISIPKAVCVFELIAADGKKTVLNGTELLGTITERIYRF